MKNDLIFSHGWLKNTKIKKRLARASQAIYVKFLTNALSNTKYSFNSSSAARSIIAFISFIILTFSSSIDPSPDS